MGAGGVIILKTIKSALQVGCNKSGSVKLWHALVLTHAVAFLAGLAL
jgi:hypothetical protein